MQQRVAIARALAPEPRVLLLDEPFSNLDPELREHTRRELRSQIHAIGITTLFVTHDQEEAFDLGDRVALLDSGRLEQVGTPEDLYRRPASAVVARFVGRASWLRGTVATVGRTLAVHLPALEVSWPATSPEQLRNGQAVELCVRPEELRIATAGDGPRAIIEARRFLGAHSLYTARLDSGDRLEILSEPGLELDHEIAVSLRPGADLPIAFAAGAES
jgi:ABC-type Fe3+/spermidine/putrescine transport system ATPase subunit